MYMQLSSQLFLENFYLMWPSFYSLRVETAMISNDTVFLILSW